jgi:hypothetical protein
MLNATVSAYDITRQDQINVGFAISHLKALFATEQALIKLGVNMVCENAHRHTVNKLDAETWWNDICKQGVLLSIIEEITEWLTDFPQLTTFQVRREQFCNEQKARIAQSLRPYQQAQRGHFRAIR